MTRLLALLSAIRDSMPAGPWVVFGDYYEQGPTYNSWDGDDELEHEPCPRHVGAVGYQLLASELRDLFEDVAHHRANGATDTEAADHGMAILMLRSIETRGDAA